MTSFNHVMCIYIFTTHPSPYRHVIIPEYCFLLPDIDIEKLLACAKMLVFCVSDVTNDTFFNRGSAFSWWLLALRAAVINKYKIAVFLRITYIINFYKDDDGAMRHDIFLRSEDGWKIRYDMTWMKRLTSSRLVVSLLSVWIQ